MQKWMPLVVVSGLLLACTTQTLQQQASVSSGPSPLPSPSLTDGDLQAQVHQAQAALGFPVGFRELVYWEAEGVGVALSDLHEGTRAGWWEARVVGIGKLPQRHASGQPLGFSGFRMSGEVCLPKYTQARPLLADVPTPDPCDSTLWGQSNFDVDDGKAKWMRWDFPMVLTGQPFDELRVYVSGMECQVSNKHPNGANHVTRLARSDRDPCHHSIWFVEDLKPNGCPEPEPPGPPQELPPGMPASAPPD